MRLRSFVSNSHSTSMRTQRAPRSPASASSNRDGDRPRRFVDEMVRGTFKRLRHVHEFHPRDGGTLMRDILELDGLLGFLLKRHMQWFIQTKQQHLKDIIERRAVRSG